MGTLNEMLVDVIALATKEYLDKGHDVKFISETENFQPKYFLYIDGKKTGDRIPYDLAEDLYVGAHVFSGPGMTGKEIYNELHEIVHTLIENEISNIQTA